MGSDDLFKKRKAARKSRQRETRLPKPHSYLIVTEGERTEPLYFNGLISRIKQHTCGGILEVLPHISIHGEGNSTTSLINKADEYVNKSKILYQHVWIVFDKDDFLDFDDAIQLAKEKGYHVAWSNQSFEYWIYLHFHYSDSALHRHEWNNKLDEIFKQYDLGDRTYQKNYENIYDLLNTYSSTYTAIKNAKRRLANFYKHDAPSSCDPATTVHILVENLLQYISN